MAFGMAMVGYGVLAFMGLWCLMFATSGGRVSGKTGAGADKRVSGFPFANRDADRKKGKGKEM